VSFLTKARGVRRSLLLFLALTTVWVALRPQPGFAQDSIDRKVKTKVSPIYPEIARKMGISGTVKLELVVALNGAVKETKVIGGHPILVTAAVDAVKKWKFEPASAESTGMVEFKFAAGE
jgi:TonB family protein